MITLARYLWASPNTLIGLTFVPFVFLTHGHAAIRDGVLELYGGGLARFLSRMPLVGGVAAITFGHIVIASNREALDTTRAHERVHVRQCERWGPFFLPAYLFASLWAAVHGQGAYHGNYFEQQARLVENQ